MSTSRKAEALFIAIDLGGTSHRGALIDANGEIVSETPVAPAREDAGGVAPQILAAIQELRSGSERGADIAAIGIGVPGLVNRKTGRVEVLPNVPEISSVDIVKDVSSATGLPVIIDNDANAAAYAELHSGVARGRSDVFYVSLGAGIGAGIVIDGNIYRGATGFAGEFGHITIDPEGIECACGNIGCLETICSGPNIVRRTRERLYRDRTSSLSRLAVPRDRELSAEDIAHAAKDGDEMAQVMMERTGMFLGIALAAVINLLNVEMIVMGGGVMEAGDLILKPTVKEARRRAFPPSFNSCEIVIARLGTSAGLIGAALLARDLAQ